MSPAARGWCAIIGGALAYDVWLVARGDEPLTHEARTPAGWTVCGIILAHFAGLLPRWLDPFTGVSTVADWIVARAGPTGRVLP